MASLINGVTLMVGEKKEVLAACSFGGKDVTSHFTLAGLLDLLKDFVALAHHKVALAGTLVEVIYIPALYLAFAQKMNENDRFQSVPQVIA
jgi:hypothetical protein